eukprot:GHVU01109283.1.p1 GENE.GHVU01109283.1~~GHVU01109283.1.p1  ORF type:complete len:114 (+),score=11.66 GHVU01109283.1:66-407(+)
MPPNVTAVDETLDSNTTMLSDIVVSSKENDRTSNGGFENTDDTSTEGGDKDHGNLILIDIVVPLVITALIVVLLILAVLYTKARRKRNAQAGRNNDHLPSISGGVPLSKLLLF